MLRSHSQADLCGDRGKPGRPPWHAPPASQAPARRPARTALSCALKAPLGAHAKSTRGSEAELAEDTDGQAAQEARTLPHTCIFMKPKGPRGGDTVWDG